MQNRLLWTRIFRSRAHLQFWFMLFLISFNSKVHIINYVESQNNYDNNTYNNKQCLSRTMYLQDNSERQKKMRGAKKTVKHHSSHGKHEEVCGRKDYVVEEKRRRSEWIQTVHDCLRPRQWLSLFPIFSRCLCLVSDYRKASPVLGKAGSFFPFIG